MYDLEVDADKVFLRMNGMQVYDLNTGANVYSARLRLHPGRQGGGRRPGAKSSASTAPWPTPYSLATTCTRWT